MTATDRTPDHDIVLPQLHRRSDYSRIVAWLKEQGDHVRRGESLLIMETDKATIELRAEVSGVLIEVGQAAGEWVPVLTRVGAIRGESEAA